ncbi:MAG: hypothetical protein AAGA34_09605, partial [Pseudomonadota bacterium]
LMLVNFGGLVALFIMGMVKAGDGLSPEINMFLGVLMSLAALPIILTSVTTAGWARWTSLALAALFTALHAWHIAAEHGPQGDTPENILIVVTMLVPSALAVWQLWNAKADPGGL